jgi:HSP20 family protein
MALAPFFGSSRSNSLWDTIPDPVQAMAIFFDESSPASSFARDARAVASTNVDWKETATEHIFKADLPGLKKEEIKVQVENGRVLSISGQRSKEEVQKTDTWHRVERSRGQFLRRFKLPDNANLDHVTANVDDGVLTIKVPKVEAKALQPRNIEIGEEQGGTGQASTSVEAGSS